jgi:hypothetical protein
LVIAFTLVKIKPSEMISFKRCICTKCGKEHLGAGRLGTTQQCRCGAWIPSVSLDRARYYWIFQVAISFSIAAFFGAFTFFFDELPRDNWERFLSPLLQVPAFTVFVVSFRRLINYKRTSNDDSLLHRYYLQGIILMTITISIALLRVTL